LRLIRVLASTKGSQARAWLSAAWNFGILESQAPKAREREDIERKKRFFQEGRKGMGSLFFG
jgi:hypothetical protein